MEASDVEQKQLLVSEVSISHPLLSLHWKELPQMPVVMDSAQSVWYNGRIYVGGGGSDWARVLSFFNDSWNVIKTPTYYYGLTIYEDHLVLVGGCEFSSDRVINNIWVYGEPGAGDEWKQDIIPPMPTRRRGVSAVGHNELLLVAGGIAENHQPIDTVELYDSKLEQWLSTTPLPRPCSWMTSTILGNHIVYAGGWEQATEVYRCSLDTIKTKLQWERLVDTPLMSSSIISINGVLLAIGGRSSESEAIFSFSAYAESEAIFSFSAHTESWDHFCDLPLPLRSTCTIVTPMGEIIAIGGISGSNYSSRVFRLSIENKAALELSNIIFKCVQSGFLAPIKNALSVASSFTSQLNGSVLDFLGQSSSSNASSIECSCSPLIVACDNEDIKMVDFLLNNQASISYKNKDNVTALHVACSKDNLKLVQRLVNIDGKLTQQAINLLQMTDKEGQNILHYACSSQCGSETLKWLLEKKVLHNMLKKKTNAGHTPLLTACQNANVAAVEVLVTYDQVDTTQCDENNQGGLHLAAMCDSSSIVELLLKRGCPSDEQDSEGNTPLHIAYKKSSSSVISILTQLDNGRIQLIMNKAGKYPADVEPDEIIPPEIKKKGTKAVELYLKALTEGKTKIPRCNLIILGQERVGKTSLYRLLVQKSFDPYLDSTRGIDNTIVEALDRRNVMAEDWSEKDDQMVEEHAVQQFAKGVVGALPSHLLANEKHAQSVSESELLNEISRLMLSLGLVMHLPLTQPGDEQPKENDTDSTHLPLTQSGDEQPKENLPLTQPGDEQPLKKSTETNEKHAQSVSESELLNEISRLMLSRGLVMHLPLTQPEDKQLKEKDTASTHLPLTQPGDEQPSKKDTDFMHLPLTQPGNKQQKENDTDSMHLPLTQPGNEQPKENDTDSMHLPLTQPGDEQPKENLPLTQPGDEQPLKKSTDSMHLPLTQPGNEQPKENYTDSMRLPLTQPGDEQPLKKDTDSMHLLLTQPVNEQPTKKDTDSTPHPLTQPRNEQPPKKDTDSMHLPLTQPGNEQPKENDTDSMHLPLTQPGDEQPKENDTDSMHLPLTQPGDEQPIKKGTDSTHLPLTQSGDEQPEENLLLTQPGDEQPLKKSTDSMHFPLTQPGDEQPKENDTDSMHLPLTQPGDEQPKENDTDSMHLPLTQSGDEQPKENLPLTQPGDEQSLKKDTDSMHLPLTQPGNEQPKENYTDSMRLPLTQPGDEQPFKKDTDSMHLPLTQPVNEQPTKKDTDSTPHPLTQPRNEQPPKKDTDSMHLPLTQPGNEQPKENDTDSMHLPLTQPGDEQPIKKGTDSTHLPLTQPGDEQPKENDTDSMHLPLTQSGDEQPKENLPLTQPGDEQSLKKDTDSTHLPLTQSGDEQPTKKGTDSTPHPLTQPRNEQPPKKDTNTMPHPLTQPGDEQPLKKSTDSMHLPLTQPGDEQPLKKDTDSMHLPLTQPVNKQPTKKDTDSTPHPLTQPRNEQPPKKDTDSMHLPLTQPGNEQPKENDTDSMHLPLTQPGDEQPIKKGTDSTHLPLTQSGDEQPEENLLLTQPGDEQPLKKSTDSMRLPLTQPEDEQPPKKDIAYAYLPQTQPGDGQPKENLPLAQPGDEHAPKQDLSSMHLPLTQPGDEQPKEKDADSMRLPLTQHGAEKSPTKDLASTHFLPTQPADEQPQKNNINDDPFAQLSKPVSEDRQPQLKDIAESTSQCPAASSHSKFKKFINLLKFKIFRKKRPRRTQEDSKAQLQSDVNSSPRAANLSNKQAMMINKELTTAASNEKVVPVLLFNTLDFAGQKEYRPMHHCFLTRRAMYLVVFNLQHIIQYLEQMQSLKVTIVNPFEEIRYWLHSIHIHTLPAVPGEEKKVLKNVCLVGTHRAPPKNSSRGKVIKDKELQKINDLIMEEIKDDDRCLSHLHFTGTDHKQVFIAVENSIDGKEEEHRKASGAQILQEEVKDITNNLPFINEDFPVSWLNFEAKLVEWKKKLEDEKSSLLIQLDKALKLATQCGVRSQEGQILALEFFHETGKIVYLKLLPRLFISDAQHAELQDLVILNPTWLIRVMQNVVELDYRSSIEGTHITRLRETGVASSTLLKEAWSRYLREPIEQSFHQFCLMLQAECLIHPITFIPESTTESELQDSTSNVTSSGSAAVSDEQLYLVPGKLPDKIKERPIACSRWTTFYFDFQKFLPNELYHRLICLLLAEMQKNKSLDKPYLSKNICQFRNIDNCHWSVEFERAKHRLKISVLFSSNDLRKPTHHINTIHTQYLRRICTLSNLEGLRYIGGPLLDPCTECGKTSVVRYVNYFEGEDQPSKSECPICLQGYDVNRLLCSQIDQESDHETNAAAQDKRPRTLPLVTRGPMTVFDRTYMNQETTDNKDTTTPSGQSHEIPQLNFRSLTIIKWKNNKGKTERLKVISSVSHKWHKIGTLLGIEPGPLETIYWRNLKDPEQCCNELFKKWLEDGSDHYSTTWDGLMELLEDADLPQVCNSLRIALRRHIP